MKLFWAMCAGAGLVAAQSGASGGPESLLNVKRIYVNSLGSGAQAAALRELIIASLDSTKLFVLTDNQERADAILKGAADDKAFTDSFDSYEGESGHQNLGKYSALTTLGTKTSGGLYGGAESENESHHTRERKHEAYAAVRLVSKNGDVLWSTTQESLGAKFRGASADVAAKIAKQIAADYEHARRAAESPAPAKP